MANVKVEVLNAVVGNAIKGQVIEVSEAEARHLVNLGYVKEVEEAKKEAPKKSPARKTAPKKDEADDK